MTDRQTDFAYKIYFLFLNDFFLKTYAIILSKKGKPPALDQGADGFEDRRKFVMKQAGGSGGGVFLLFFIVITFYIYLEMVNL